MKGYVLQEKGLALWKEIPDPIMGPYDAIVRPTAVAACTTDIHLIQTAAWPDAMGKAIGHEAVGVVERVGELVKDFSPGDRAMAHGGFSLPDDYGVFHHRQCHPGQSGQNRSLHH